MKPDSSDPTRREFLKTTSMAALGAFLASAMPEPAQGQTPTAVPTRAFGKTGATVPILGLGGMFDIPTNQLVLRQAYQWGVTYWDTADCYGGSETGMGMYFEKHPDHRKDIFLVTKSCERDAQGMTRLLEQSLNRLKTDYIDLYLVHGARHIDELSDEIRRWAEKEKSRKRIRFMGFSTHANMEKLMLAASRLGWIDGIMMSYNFRLMHTDQMQAAVEACTKAGIGLTAMKTQGGGSVRADSEAEIALAGRFLKKGFTDKQARLKAVWENPHIACICSQMPGMTVLMSNVTAALDQTRLSKEEVDLFRQLALQTAPSYCAGCAEICEKALDIPAPVSDVMRCLMYCHSYGEPERAEAIFNRIPKDLRDAMRLADYSKIQRLCPQKMPVARLMREGCRTLDRRFRYALRKDDAAIQPVSSG
jgi:predicted aldo/keto reductase-like oxidoreductase